MTSIQYCDFGDVFCWCHN